MELKVSKGLSALTEEEELNVDGGCCLLRGLFSMFGCGNKMVSPWQQITPCVPSGSGLTGTEGTGFTWPSFNSCG